MTDALEKSTTKVVIIGGGISGLAAAYRLLEQRTQSNRKFEILLLEASAYLGGIIRTERRDGFLLEGGPDSFISEKPEAVALAKRLGLESRLIETNEEYRRSFIVRGGKLHAVPEGFQLLAPTRFWPFVTSSIFSWPGKARMQRSFWNTCCGAADSPLAGPRSSSPGIPWSSRSWAAQWRGCLTAMTSTAWVSPYGGRCRQ